VEQPEKEMAGRLTRGPQMLMEFVKLDRGFPIAQSYSLEYFRVACRDNQRRMDTSTYIFLAHVR
jgi:hypothetical protein